MTGRKQKILLIRASYLDSHMGLVVTPPLGLLTLTAVLRKERSKTTDVRALDTGLERMDIPEAAKFIREYDPDVVGISALTLEASALHDIARVVKEINAETKVITGGPHSHSFYDEVVKDLNVDYAVVGEGEKTIVELIDHIREGAVPENVPGVAYMLKGQLFFTEPGPPIQDLDSIPFPAWDKKTILKYSAGRNMNGIISRFPYTAMFTSRACPYKCTYCHNIFGKEFRAQTPERVLEEMKWLTRKYGIKEIHFFDDVFNFKKKRTMEIMEGIRERGIDVKMAFPNGIRGDIMTKDLIEAFARAGVYCMTYAVETASLRLQKLIKKNLDLDKVKEVAAWTFDAGIIPAGFFMLGFPTETREELEQTVQYARNSRFLLANFFNVAPFPRTDLYELARKTYPDFHFDYEFSPNMHYWTSKPYFSEVSGIDVMELRKYALKKFYIVPWRIFHNIKKIPITWILLISLFHGFAYWLVKFGRRKELSPVERSMET